MRYISSSLQSTPGCLIRVRQNVRLLLVARLPVDGASRAERLLKSVTSSRLMTRANRAYPSHSVLTAGEELPVVCLVHQSRCSFYTRARQTRCVVSHVRPTSLFNECRHKPGIHVPSSITYNVHSTYLCSGVSLTPRTFDQRPGVPRHALRSNARKATKELTGHTSTVWSQAHFLSPSLTRSDTSTTESVRI